MSRIPASRGFTVVEILLVVLIMAISAAIVVPMVGNRDDIVMSAATRKVVADFQYAQNLAIATRGSIYIRFDDNRYELSTLSGGTFTTITHPVEKDPFIVAFGAGGDSNLSRATMPAPSIAAKDILGFDSLGTPFAYDKTTQTRTDLTATATLSLTVGDLTREIRVEPYTGEITVP